MFSVRIYFVNSNSMCPCYLLVCVNTIAMPRVTVYMYTPFLEPLYQLLHGRTSILSIIYQLICALASVCIVYVCM